MNTAVIRPVAIKIEPEIKERIKRLAEARQDVEPPECHS